MIKHFYSYQVDIASVDIEIDSLNIEDHEKNHLKSLAESHIHHVVIDAVLSELDTEDKKTFMSYLNAKDHEKIWKFLHARLKNAEDTIEKAAAGIKKELLTDIRNERSK
ncbi:MAG TPA: hypothetical protein VHE53_03680 [Patescibacteria group bacterium]|nr:hypothetical protein [Patescibacteria group bacterium]